MSRKEQILETALKLFAENGYDSTSTSLIAKTAGVSEGLIFRHYGKKEGLLEAILENGMGQVAATFAVLEGKKAAKGRLLRYIEFSFNTLQENILFWKLLHSIRGQAKVQQAVGEQLEESTRYIIQTLTRIFDELGSPQSADDAMLLFATIDGVAMHYTLQPDVYPLDTIKKLVIKNYNEKF